MQTIRLKKPVLFLMLGVPGAGKTFFARQFAKGMHIGHVSGERLRYELFDKPKYDDQENAVILRLMDYAAEVLLESGVSVIYDDVAIGNYQQRSLRRTMATQSSVPALTIWVQTDNATAFGRANNKNRKRANEKYGQSVSKTDFERLAKTVDQPQYREDFVVVSGKYPFKSQSAAVLKNFAIWKF